MVYGNDNSNSNSRRRKCFYGLPGTFTCSCKSPTRASCGISAAGVLPIVIDKRGKASCLLMVEPKKPSGNPDDVLNLTLIGGKVEPEDTDWLATVLRETREELGDIDASSVIQKRIEMFGTNQQSARSCKPVWLSCQTKYMLLLLPFHEGDHSVKAILSLPQRYHDRYRGQCSCDEIEKDWTRMGLVFTWAQIEYDKALQRGTLRWSKGQQVVHITSCDGQSTTSLDLTKMRCSFQLMQALRLWNPALLCPAP